MSTQSQRLWIRPCRLLGLAPALYEEKHCCKYDQNKVHRILKEMDKKTENRDDTSLWKLPDFPEYLITSPEIYTSAAPAQPVNIPEMGRQ